MLNTNSKTRPLASQAVMKMRILVLSLTALLVGGFNADDALAQGVFTKTGSVGAQFLKIGVGSRYLGMGEAAVAAKGDAFSLYWNPAALTEIEGHQLAFSRADWILDVTLTYAAYAHRFEGVGVFALGLTAMNMPEMEVTTTANSESQDGIGQFYNASSYALELGFARELTPRFALGGGVKYIYESIFTETSSGFAFDIGTIMYTGLRSLRLGMNISNLGGGMRFSGPRLAVQVQSESDTTNTPDSDGRLLVESYELPLVFRLGMAYDFDFNMDSRLTVTTELKHPNDNVQQGAVGLEYGWKERFFLRGGYKINYDEEDLTFGAGLNTPFGQESNLSLDYAWTDFGRLQSTHRFSVNVAF